MGVTWQSMDSSINFLEEEKMNTGLQGFVRILWVGTSNLRTESKCVAVCIPE